MKNAAASIADVFLRCAKKSKNMNTAKKMRVKKLVDENGKSEKLPVTKSIGGTRKKPRIHGLTRDPTIGSNIGPLTPSIPNVIETSKERETVLKRSERQPNPVLVKLQRWTCRLLKIYFGTTISMAKQNIWRC